MARKRRACTSGSSRTVAGAKLQVPNVHERDLQVLRQHLVDRLVADVAEVDQHAAEPQPAALLLAEGVLQLFLGDELLREQQLADPHTALASLGAHGCGHGGTRRWVVEPAEVAALQSCSRAAGSLISAGQSESVDHNRAQQDDQLDRGALRLLASEQLADAGMSPSRGVL